MKKSKLEKMLSIVLVVVMTIVYTGCSSNDNSAVIESLAETANYASTDGQVVDEEDENMTATLESQDSSMTFSIDDAITIAESGFKAMNALDAEEMVKYINLEVFYYIANGEYIVGEELVTELAAVMSESNLEDGYNNLGIVGNYAALENVEFYDAQLYSTDELNELNEFITDDNTILWGEAEGLEYNIESVYKLKMKYDGIEEGNEPYVLVVCANGEWKLDICISMMKDVFDILSEMEFDDSHISLTE